MSRKWHIIAVARQERVMHHSAATVSDDDTENLRAAVPGHTHQPYQ
jgi:hypothetical protein